MSEGGKGAAVFWKLRESELVWAFGTGSDLRRQPAKVEEEVHDRGRWALVEPGVVCRCLEGQFVKLLQLENGQVVYSLTFWAWPARCSC